MENKQEWELLSQSFFPFLQDLNMILIQYKKLQMGITFYFTIFILFSCQIESVEGDFPFQKKIWSFWDDQNLNMAPLLVQACHQKILKAAQAAGFSYTVLNLKNSPDFISNFEQKIVKVREKSLQKAIQHLADLIRFHVIYEHGGIWLDMTTVLIDGLDWLLNIESQKYRHLITNRFSDKPEALLFYFLPYQNSAQYYVQKDGDKVYYNQFPGYEIWFIAAKKNHPLIQEIALTYSEFTQMPFWDMMARFQRENIFMNSQDGGSYLSGNMAISYVLQKKQFQLDKQLGIFAPRSTVYDHYKLWSLNALLGPLQWSIWNSDDFLRASEYPLAYYEQKSWPANFFIKIVGEWTRKFSQRLNLTRYIYSNQNWTFEQFMDTDPDMQSCKWFIFLVEGSLIANIFDGTNYLADSKIPMISIEQHKRWKSYCSKFNFTADAAFEQSFYDKALNTIIFPDFATKRFYRKTEELSNPQKKNSDKSMLKRIESIFYDNNIFLELVLQYSVNGFIAFCVYASICWIWRRVKFVLNMLLRNELVQSNWTLKSLLKSIALNILVIATIGLSSFLHYSIDLFGTRDQPFTMFLSLIVIFSFQHIVQVYVFNKRTLQKETVFYYAFFFYEGVYLMLTYWSTYIVLTFMIMNKSWLQFSSIIIGVVGQILFKLACKITQNYSETVNSQQIMMTDSLMRFTLWCRNTKMFRKLSLVFLFLVWIVPKSRYLTLFQSYLVSYIPSLLLIYLACLYICMVSKSQYKLESLQKIRLYILPLLVVATYILISFKNLHITNPYLKTKWNLIAVALFSTIYVQLGSTYAQKQVITLKSVGKYFSVLVLVMLFSPFVQTNKINDVNQTFSYLVLIMANNLLISLSINKNFGPKLKFESETEQIYLAKSENQMDLD